MEEAERDLESVPIHANWMSSDEIFRLFVESVCDYAIFMLDPQGFVRSWNMGAERAKGYRAEEIIGRHFSTFYTAEDRASGLPDTILNRAVKDGRVEQEGWRVRKDGTLFWADVVVTAVYDPSGKLIGFAKVTRDMTEMRQLTYLRDEATRASQAKSAFLANMSHELRTPLNAIIGYSEMLGEELRDSGLTNLREDVDRIRFSGEHLLSVISDVLDLSRIEAGRLDLQMENVSLQDLIPRVVDSVRPLADNNKNVMLVSMDPDCPTARADATRLRQVLYNILSNACKFTSAGKITVSVFSDDSSEFSRVAVSISDTGVGMTPEQLQHVFDRFYQVETNSKRSGGTGLGLAISKLLCEAMGAEIQVTSAPGKGSMFTLLLPPPLFP